MVISSVDIIFLQGIPKENIYVGIKELVQSLGLGLRAGGWKLQHAKGRDRASPRARGGSE